MENIFYEHGELKDSKIIKALSEATENYKDGAIVETRNLLIDIIWAIDEFIKNYKG